MPLTTLSLIAGGLGAASSLASAIISGVQSKKQMDSANKIINGISADNKAWYDRKMNEDFTKSSQNQATLKKTKQLLDEYYGRVNATSVGSTDEARALNLAQANKAVDDAQTSIAAQATANKEAAEQQFRQNDIALKQQQSQNKVNAAGQISAAGAQGVQAGLNLVGTAIDTYAKVPVPNATGNTSETQSTENYGIKQ